MGITDAADRRHELPLGQALRVIHGKILNAPVAVVDQPIFRAGPSGMDRLFQGIQD